MEQTKKLTQNNGDYAKYDARVVRLALKPTQKLTHFSVAVPDEAAPDSLLFSGHFVNGPVSLRLALPFTAGALLVLGLPVEEPEALVAEARVGTESGELDGELDDLGRLELGDVERGVEHAELESAVVAHVGAAPL